MATTVTAEATTPHISKTVSVVFNTSRSEHTH